MNNLTLFILSLFVGIMGSHSKKESMPTWVRWLNSSLLATCAALAISVSITLIAVLITARQLPSIEQINRWGIDQIEMIFSEGDQFENQIKNYF